MASNEVVRSRVKGRCSAKEILGLIQNEADELDYEGDRAFWKELRDSILEKYPMEQKIEPLKFRPMTDQEQAERALRAFKVMEKRECWPTIFVMMDDSISWEIRQAQKSSIHEILECRRRDPVSTVLAYDDHCLDQDKPTKKEKMSNADVLQETIDLAKFTPAVKMVQVIKDRKCWPQCWIDESGKIYWTVHEAINYEEGAVWVKSFSDPVVAILAYDDHCREKDRELENPKIKPIDDMPKDELDDAVAIEVMGWTNINFNLSWASSGSEGRQLIDKYEWHPTRNIVQAFEALNSIGEDYAIHTFDKKYGCTIHDPNPANKGISGVHETRLKVAICRALIKWARRGKE